MIDKVQSIWILLSRNAVQCCNEPPKSINDTEPEHMSLDLFYKITEYARERSWACTILGSRNGIPSDHLKICHEIEATVVLPADYEGPTLGKNVKIVFDQSQIGLASKHTSVSHAILRIERDRLSQLSADVRSLFNYYHDVSIRHPNLLLYDDRDITTFKNQLLEISRSLLDKNKSWHNYRLDCITDRFHGSTYGECNAGVKRLAVSPGGNLYLCPAAMRNGAPTYGHVLGDVKLPNEQLLTREYSVPCGKCEAIHCLRCVYLSKLGTSEFCVPAKNVCRLAHFELEAQAWFAQEAIKENLWNNSYIAPIPPTIYDPYELIKTEDTPPISELWRRLVTFDGRIENLQPCIMLDIIHGLQGWCQALVDCAKAGSVPSIELIEHSVLANLRRHTIEQYRDVKFAETCPTVRELELLMCEVTGKILSQQ